MNPITLHRTAREITVTTPAGELGYIVCDVNPRDRRDVVFIPYANRPKRDGYERSVTPCSEIRKLRDAVAFITAEGVAL